MSLPARPLSFPSSVGGGVWASGGRVTGWYCTAKKEGGRYGTPLSYFRVQILTTPCIQSTLVCSDPSYFPMRTLKPGGHAQRLEPAPFFLKHLAASVIVHFQSLALCPAPCLLCRSVLTVTFWNLESPGGGFSGLVCDYITEVESPAHSGWRHFPGRDPSLCSWRKGVSSCSCASFPASNCGHDVSSCFKLPSP